MQGSGPAFNGKVEADDSGRIQAVDEYKDGAVVDVTVEVAVDDSGMAGVDEGGKRWVETVSGGKLEAYKSDHLGADGSGSGKLQIVDAGS